MNVFFICLLLNFRTNVYWIRLMYISIYLFIISINNKSIHLYYFISIP
jgi:hypothetical protein